MNTINITVDGKESLKTEPKYKIGDRVKYIDIGNARRTGNIIEIILTDVYEWNKDEEQRYMYLLTSSPYYRYEDEVLKVVNEVE